jgi:GNAT superfamily N-acetyltransferase
MTIKQVSAKDTYVVRHAVLRKGRPLEDCAFAGDNLATTIHLGSYLQDTLVGVASFVLHKDEAIIALEHIDKQYCYQLRGMAVSELVQGQQVGTRLLRYGEQLLNKKGCTHLWFSARELAVPFYQKLDYTIVSDLFEINAVGMHCKMYKAL